MTCRCLKIISPPGKIRLSQTYALVVDLEYGSDCLIIKPEFSGDFPNRPEW